MGVGRLAVLGLLRSPDEVRRSVAEDERRRQVVPGTTLADLDDVHPELVVIMSHLDGLRHDLCRTGLTLERIPVDISLVGDVLPLAHRAEVFGRFAEVACRAKEAWLWTADRSGRSTPGAQGSDHGSLRRAAIHHPSL